MSLKQLFKPGKVMKVAAFMSGTGSNLRKIIENKEGYEVVMIFTDNPKSNAEAIAKESGIPYYCSDIKQYYKDRGHEDRKDMGIRMEYDKETVKLLEKHEVDVVALCGYWSIVSEGICGRYLTINVHPADLRILDDEGKRLFAGCVGAGCVKRAVL